MDSRLNNFILKFVFTWEGTSFENDSDDPGGATKYGIDQRSHPQENIKDLSQERAVEIYEQEFKDDGCLLYPAPVDLVMFDTAINCGKTRANLCLQLALNVVADSVIGIKTMTSLHNSDPKLVAQRVITQRETFYRDLAKKKPFGKFLRGWLNRTAALREYIA
jgi:lysozyme family protein